MINFKENFFFVKFSVLFFILTIFGYWGIDLNSEELYIAFSFFFLVILTFVLVRRAILLFFVRSVNSKYFRILFDLVITITALRLQIRNYKFLLRRLPSLSNIKRKFIAFLIRFIHVDLRVFSSMYSARLNLLSSRVFTSWGVFIKKLVKIRRLSAYSGSFGRFFDIKL